MCGWVGVCVGVCLCVCVDVDVCTCTRVCMCCFLFLCWGMGVWGSFDINLHVSLVCFVD